MFESITIGPFGAPDAKIDVGLLAECLLFYGKVRVLTSGETFKNLVRVCGSEELLELCDMGVLEIEFLDNFTAILSRETNLGACHDLGLITSTHIRFPQIVRKVVEEEAGGSGRRAERLFRRFNKAVTRSEYTADMIKGSQDDIKNRAYLEQTAKRLLPLLAPEHRAPDPLIIRPETTPKFGIRYDTNIDFADANRSFQRHVSLKGATLTLAYLLAQITSAEADIAIASKAGSEFAVDPVKNAIVSSRMEEIIQKAASGQEKIQAFKDVVIEGSRSVREVVNSGDRTFRDVIQLVQEAQKFRDWIRKVNDDSQIRDEYCKKIASLDWADSLPPKSLRFTVMTGLSILAGLTMTPAAGVAVGIGLNATDYFLLDRILKGWKPNQFVSGPLHDFLKKD